MIKELNREQLTGLSNLCFDLAKGAFAIGLLPIAELSDDPLAFIIRMILAIIAGLAFSYFALLLLEVKERKRI